MAGQSPLVSIARGMFQADPHLPDGLQTLRPSFSLPRPGRWSAMDGRHDHIQPFAVCYSV